jgi:uncharacterized protein
VRAVLDPNVIISALLTPAGAPGKILRKWIEGAFELVVSPQLLAELERALAYPKLRRRITEEDGAELLDLLRSEARIEHDPGSTVEIGSPDPGDDYLIALAAAARALLVSGDGHLLGLSRRLPVVSPATFLARLDA